MAYGDGPADRALHDARIARARRGVDRLAQIDLVGEGHEIERVGIGVEMPVGARRRGRLRPRRRIDQRHRLAGAADRGFADLVGMREGGGLAAHRAQAEARIGVVRGGLEPPVIEAECLRLAILEVELAIVALLQRLLRECLGFLRGKLAGMVEKRAGIGGQGHPGDIGALPPSASAIRQAARRHRQGHPSARSGGRNSRNRQSPSRRSQARRADGPALRRHECPWRRRRKRGWNQW